MSLTNTQIRNLKYDTTNPKRQKYSDGGQLYLEVKPSGKKFWYMDYTSPHTGKRRTLSFGEYPYVSLADARAKREEVKTLLAQGLDPQTERERQSVNLTFAEYAKEYLEYVKQNRAFGTYCYKEQALRLHILPKIGNFLVTDITPKILKTKLFNERTRNTKAIERQIKAVTSMVLDVAIRDDVIQTNAAKKLVPSSLFPEHFSAATTEQEFAEIIRIMHKSMRFNSSTGKALLVCLYTWQRPNEIVRLKWEHIDFKTKRITYNVSKTKTNHIVPISKQVEAILLSQLGNNSEYVFHSSRAEGYILPITLPHKMRRANLAGKQSVHGFRATARTLIEEVLKYPAPHIIEHQLAHRVKDPNGTAYNRTKFIEERHELMQRWADYVDALRDGRDTTQFCYHYTMPVLNKLKLVG